MGDNFSSASESSDSDGEDELRGPKGKRPFDLNLQYKAPGNDMLQISFGYQVIDDKEDGRILVSPDMLIN